MVASGSFRHDLELGPDAECISKEHWTQSKKSWVLLLVGPVKSYVTLDKPPTLPRL